MGHESVADDHLSVSGEWPQSYAGCCINSLELEAILLALREFSEHLHQVVLLILSDNNMIVYLTKQGGTHSALPCRLAWQIFQLAQSLAFEIQVHHITGKWNVLADSLLRICPLQTEWALDHVVFQALVAHFGLSLVIDLLATALNSQLLVFISPILDLAAFGVYALSVPWDSFMTAHAFPPIAIVHDMLMRLQGLNLTRILIALRWPNQSWFPDLLMFSIDHTVELP